MSARLVDDGLVAGHHAVDRHDLAGADDDDVAGDDASTGTSSSASSRRRCAMRGARSTSAVSSRRARRLADGLQRVAAGEHQRDHRAGEVLAERERAGHREQRDRVDAEVMIDDDGATHLERELGGKQRHRGPPHLVPGVSCAERVQQESGGDRDDRDHSEDLRAGLGELVQRRADAHRLIRTPGTSPVEHDARLSCRHPCPAAAESGEVP